MAGRGPAPKRERRPRSKAPTRGEWKAAKGLGWQHGAIPKPPSGLMPASRSTWTTWFRAWYAAHWRPEDVPALKILIQLYDQVQRGEYQRAGELRLGMDGWGITPKGQQDRRWVPPLGQDAWVTEEEPKPEPPPTGEVPEVYRGLRVAR